MKSFETKFQIGKEGLTQGVITSLTNTLKHHRQVRVSVLKSAGRDKETVKKMASEIQGKLPIPTGYKIVGFTIILRRERGNL